MEDGRRLNDGIGRDQRLFDLRLVRSLSDGGMVGPLIFTHKNNNNLDYVMRRGMTNVRAELLGKVLAYNLARDGGRKALRRHPNAKNRSFGNSGP